MKRGEVEPVLWVPLRTAMLCVSCEALFHRPHPRCPACDSDHHMPVAQWLGSLRDVPRERRRS